MRQKSLIILLCFLATLFFGGHLWRFKMRGKPFCCSTTGAPIIVVQGSCHISEMPSVHTYGGAPAQDVTMTA